MDVPPGIFSMPSFLSKELFAGESGFPQEARAAVMAMMNKLRSRITKRKIDE